MADSGEAQQSPRSNRSGRRDWKCDATEALCDSLGELKKAVKSHHTANEASQKQLSKTELYKQLGMLLQMCRELLEGESVQRELLEEELEKVTSTIRQS